jgi:hypothetical protein
MEVSHPITIAFLAPTYPTARFVWIGSGPAAYLDELHDVSDALARKLQKTVR